MRTRILINAGVTALGSLLFLGGCAAVPPPSPVERDYGLSHRLAVYGQTANPDAENNLEPVVGIEGKLALGIMLKYRTSFGYQPVQDSTVFDLHPFSSGPASQPPIVNLNSSNAGSAAAAGAYGVTGTVPGKAGTGDAHPENRSALP